MRKREAVLAVVILAAVLIITMYYDNQEHGRVIRYDCSIAEISPDYPVAVREACRHRRAERAKENE